MTVIDYFTFQHKHLKVTNIDDMTETLYVKLPENMTRCDHLPITCEYLLGRGATGPCMHMQIMPRSNSMTL